MKTILYLALVLLIMCLMLIPFVSVTSPEFIAIIMATSANALTVLGSWLYMHFTSKKVNK